MTKNICLFSVLFVLLTFLISWVTGKGLLFGGGVTVVVLLALFSFFQLPDDR